MKKIVFLFLLLFFSTTAAQFLKGYGIKTGLVITQQDWNYSLPIGLDPDNKLGINIGVFAEIFEISNFSVLTELNYIQKGAHKKSPITTPEHPNGTGETAEWKLELNYLNFSALGKGSYDLGVLAPYFLFGPKLDYEINKSIKNDNSSLYNDFNKYRFGIKTGLGVEFRLIAINLLAEFVYDLDINSLYKSKYLEIKTNSFNINLGIYL